MLSVTKYSSVEEMAKIWSENRPTSVILPYNDNLAPNLTGKNKGLAVRLPKDIFLRKILPFLVIFIILFEADFDVFSFIFILWSLIAQKTDYPIF